MNKIYMTTLSPTLEIDVSKSQSSFVLLNKIWFNPVQLFCRNLPYFMLSGSVCSQILIKL